MKHRPRLPDESVNTSREHPLRELLRLSVALSLALIALYIVSGWLVDVVVQRLDPNTGADVAAQIGLATIAEFGPLLHTQRAQRSTEIFADLIEATQRNPDNYRLIAVDNKLVNAAALPGGIIVVFGGLLEVVDSENELAMVLSHELGHLDNKDHLRMLGRGILTASIAALVFGNTDALNARLLSVTSRTLERRFSRRRELAADLIGLDTVCRHYGHSGGAIDFFARQASGRGGFAFFATHPSSERRVAHLRALALARDCPPGATVALPPMATQR